MPAEAIGWLTGQQCANGSWIAYRPDASVPCPAEGFPSPETNATASAVVGLVRAGVTEPVTPGLDWLASVQNDDGGWGFLAGDATDPNSTAVVLMALATAGVADEAPLRRRHCGAAAPFQLGCASAAADRGSFTFPDTGGAANLYATVQAVAGALGRPLPLTVAEEPVPGLPTVGLHDDHDDDQHHHVDDVDQHDVHLDDDLAPVGHHDEHPGRHRAVGHRGQCRCRDVRPRRAGRTWP